MPGPSVFPSGEPGVSGDFWGSHALRHTWGESQQLYIIILELRKFQVYLSHSLGAGKTWIETGTKETKGCESGGCSCVLGSGAYHNTRSLLSGSF